MRPVSQKHSGAVGLAAWVAGLSRLIWIAAPGKLFVAILTRVLAQFAQLFSFFIPIKIIILMGSAHIPSYFAGVMTIENRDTWIAGMAMLTLLVYVTAILLNLLSGRLESHATRQFLQVRGPAFAPDKEQRGRVRRMIVLLTRIHVAGVILLLCVIGLLILNPWMLLVLGVLLLTQLALTLWSARHPDARWRGWPGRAALGSPDRYFQMLAALDFMAVFGLLLAEYWVTGRSEMLTAILILLLGRRLFQSAAKAASRTVLLQRERVKLECLLNPDCGAREMP